MRFGGLALLAGLVACGTEDSEPTRSVSPIEATWMAKIVKDPGSFTTRVSASREGWIAVHRNDWSAAVAAGGDPASRAHGELARYYRVLAELDGEVWARLGERWRARGPLPAGSQIDWFVGTALNDAGREEEAKAWRSGDNPDATITARKALHDTIRGGAGDAAALRAPGFATLLHEPADGGTRDLSDPWLLHTLALDEARRASAAPPLDPSLFSGDLGAPLALPEPDTDPVADADACRERVRAMDAELDAWRVGATAAASPDGLALLHDLRLVDATRARALVDAAVGALDAGRPACALALGQLALDHESPREVGPANSPTLFAVVASADLRVGRTREALDAIDVLAHDAPEVEGLAETLGTLVVLEGLDRRGDSRE